MDRFPGWLFQVAVVLVGEEDKVCALSARVTAAVIPAGQVVRDISEERQIGADVVGVFLDANYAEGSYYCWHILVERFVIYIYLFHGFVLSIHCRIHTFQITTQGARKIKHLSVFLLIIFVAVSKNCRLVSIPLKTYW